MIAVHIILSDNGQGQGHELEILNGNLHHS